MPDAHLDTELRVVDRQLALGWGRPSGVAFAVSDEVRKAAGVGVQAEGVSPGPTIEGLEGFAPGGAARPALALSAESQYRNEVGVVGALTAPLHQE